ncbi:MAG: bifunctional diaminohydroxyphosphoribosylaminopyrimidine deaminase/5-amino-6-(5-phosphoribosylamino)uracil reductase RibD [Planctomycetota bacterium]
MYDADLMKEAMGRALALAERGRGTVEPNPMVGAVLLQGDEIVAEGYTQPYGGPHAEAQMLADAAARDVSASGGTVCVTLEPCSHVGKTPPCAEALIAAGVARVVVATQDPYHEVAGRGIQALRDAGIVVDVGLMEAEARRQNEAFFKRVTTGLPWVIVKWAQTLDGKTATATGHSQWISNERSRLRVHELRGRVDAVMVGVGTAIADDPLLTARLPDGQTPQRAARRLVVDRSGRLPATAAMLHDGGPPVSVLTGDLGDELRQLAADGVTNVLVEGGATLVGALLREQLVDQLLVFTAPKLVGDAAALPAVQGLPCDSMDEALALELVDVERLGDDVLLDYRVNARPLIGRGGAPL